VYGEYRRFWDTWGIHANTYELGYSRHIGDDWLVDGHARYYKQGDAVFYADNFTREMTYMSRNRQLSAFTDKGLGGKVSYSAWRVPGRFELKVNGAAEWLRFNYNDFTDIRSGSRYSFSARMLELFVSAYY